MSWPFSFLPSPVPAAHPLPKRTKDLTTVVLVADRARPKTFVGCVPHSIIPLRPACRPSLPDPLIDVLSSHPHTGPRTFFTIIFLPYFIIFCCCWPGSVSNPAGTSLNFSHTSSRSTRLWYWWRPGPAYRFDQGSGTGKGRRLSASSTRLSASSAHLSSVLARRRNVTMGISRRIVSIPC